MHHDVAIVGGGPAGACLAWSLAASGLDVVVLDRAHFPRPKPCAEYLSPEASRILAKMGVLEDIEAGGAAQLRGMTVHAPDGTVFRGEFAAAHGFRGFRDRGVAIPRTELDTLLVERARAAGARVIEGARVSDVLRDAQGRALGVRTGGMHGDIRRARLVVGADGLRSVVARRLGLVRSAAWPRRIALVAHYEGVRGVGAYGEMHVHRDGYLGIADVGRGRTNVALVVPAHAARTMGGDPEAFMDAWIGAHPPLADRLAPARRLAPPMATGPFAVRARRAWAPGAALVGDAADFFDPFTGEGIFAALRGAELLAGAVGTADAFASARALDTALAAYDRARTAAFRGKWRVERLVGAAVAVPWLMNRAARALSRRTDLADLLVGVAGDFVPPAQVLHPRFIAALLGAAVMPARWPGAPAEALRQPPDVSHPTQ